MTEPGSEFVQSLSRGLAVIRAFDSHHRRQTLSDVARSTGLTRATARRLLLTLADLGYVRCADSRFELTPRILELGYSYLSASTLPDVAVPHLEDLTALVGESSSVSVLDGSDIVYIARVPVSRIMAVAITIGTRFPAHATSMGRVLLAGLPPAALDDFLSSATLSAITEHTVTSPEQLRADLDTVRAQGYSIVGQELEEGLRSMSVPIHDGKGDVVAAVNLSTSYTKYTVAQLRRELLPPLMRTAERISSDLAHTDSR